MLKTLDSGRQLPASCLPLTGVNNFINIFVRFCILRASVAVTSACNCDFVLSCVANRCRTNINVRCMHQGRIQGGSGK